MKELKETIIEAVQDATDSETGRVSISYLAALLDELLPEALNIHDVVGRSEQLKAFDEVFQIAWELVQEESDYSRLLKIKKSL